jgi:hypothetical protein
MASRMLKLIAAFFFVATAACINPALAQEGETRLELIDAPSMQRFIAGVLLGRETGQPIDEDAITYESISINGYGFPELFVYSEQAALCPGGTCRVRLFALVDGEYRDLLAGLGPQAEVAPGQIAILGQINGGYSQLSLAGTVFMWTGERYAEKASVAPTKLDDVAFRDVCSRYLNLDASIRMNGGTPEDQSAVCGCIADGFSQRGLGGEVLDLFAREIDGTISDAEKRQLGKAREFAYTNGYELQTVCMAARGWDSEPSPPLPANPPDPIASDVSGFVAACRAQDWIVSNGKIGSDDRALAFCACTATGMSAKGLAQEDFDALVPFYEGSVSDDELSEQRPDTLLANDEVSETCLQDMPAR